MQKLNLNLETITPIGNFTEFKQYPIVLNNGYIYLVNAQKLDKILSLMKMLFEYNEVYNTLNDKNITTWLQQKGLLSQELLDEISLYKIKDIQNEKILGIYRFSTEQMTCWDKDFNNMQIENFCKTAIKNILLFEYYQKNNIQLNDYLHELILFLEKNPGLLYEKSLNLSLKSIFEIDKRKLQEIFQNLDNINILIRNNLSKPPDYLCFKKATNEKNAKFHEVIKNGLVLGIEIQINRNRQNNINLEKYLTLFENITQKRLNLFSAENSHKIINTSLKNDIEMPLKGTNFCFLSQTQILYLCLSAENRQKLNMLLKNFYGETYDNEIYYFDLSAKSNLQYFNYAKLGVL